MKALHQGEYILGTRQRCQNSHQAKHICFVYESEEEYRAMIAFFLRQGLARSERVLSVKQECARGGATIRYISRLP
nr:MEDS domain-containing protein [Chloroflexota bacterium]